MTLCGGETYKRIMNEGFDDLQSTTYLKKKKFIIYMHVSVN